MPQVPTYNRQQGIPAQANAVQGNVASAGAGFGQAGEAIGKIADNLMAADQRIKARKDAIYRARDLTNTARTLHDELTDWSTGDDLTDPDAIDRFGDLIDKRIGKVLSDHKGSKESRDRLEIRLEGVRQQIGARASALGIQQQRKLADDVLGTRIGELSGSVVSNPASLNDAFKSLDADIKDMSGALTPDEERSKRQAGRSVILKSAIQSLLDREGFAEAKALMDNTQGVNEILSPNDAIRIRSAITAKEVAIGKAQNAGKMELAKAEQILGRPLGADERAKLAGVRLSEGGLPEKITQMETALNRPLSAVEIKRLGGLTSGDFGSGLTGRSLEMMTEGAPSFAAGLMTPDEERNFISAVTQYTQPTSFQNPDTGIMETRSPRLPPFVVEAMKRRGIEPPASATGNAPRTDTMQPGQQGRTSAENAMGGKTIFDMAGNITGPVPAVGEALSRTPGIGSVVQAPQMIQARRFAEIASRDLIRVYQNNPKYAEGERQSLEKELSISPRLYDTPDAYRNHLISIDDSMAVRANNAFKTAQNPNTGRDERTQALNILNAITNFRATLGVPQRVKNAEEADKLPPGAPFITPDGRIKTNTPKGGAGGGEN